MRFFKLDSIPLLTLIWLIGIAPLQVQAQAIDSLKVELLTQRNDSLRIETFITLSKAYQQQQTDSAFLFAQKANELSKKKGYTALLIKSLRQQGVLYINQGNFDEAMEVMLEGLKLQEASGATSVALLINLGVVFDRKKLYERAIEYYDRTLVIMDADPEAGRKEGRAYVYATVHSNLGAAYSSLKQYDKAKAHYEKALHYSIENSDKKNQAIINTNLGNLSSFRGDEEEAIRYFRKGLAIRKELNDRTGLVKSYGHIGGYHKRMSNFDSATWYLEKSFALSEELGMLSYQMQTASLLGEVYADLGEYQKAYEKRTLERFLSDSINSAASYQKITQLEMQYEFDKKQHELEVIRKEKEMSYLVIGSTLMIALLIACLLYMYQRNRLKIARLEKTNLLTANEALEEKLHFKNKELTTNVMYLLKKNELIREVTERLVELKKDLKEENHKPVRKIISNLQSASEKSVWEEFEHRFQQVHEEFYENLGKQFPDLTPNDLRLSAFLRLNMTTKEISSITQQNPKTVDVARTRLRKKLKLTGTDTNLITFLSEF